MEVITSKEAEKKFGITDEQIDAWEVDLAAGKFHEEPHEVIEGRTDLDEAHLKLH